MTTGSSITPLVFGSADAPLFGVLTLPDPGHAVDRGVVICAPLGYENVVYYRQLAVLARLLGNAGRPTLRFDWPGCGDSAGDDNDLDQVEAYVDSVGAAVQALRERAGVGEVDLVGLRIGATLALAAAARFGTMSDIVLWAPYTTGRAYLREMHAFQQLTQKKIDDPDLLPYDGQQDASGFLLTESTIEGFRAIDLLATELSDFTGRVLLAGRDEQPDERLAGYLRGQGVTVDATVLGGLREVALGWTERPVPVAAFEAIEDWLTPGTPTGRTPAAPPVEPSMPLRVGDISILETPAVIDSREPIFGIVATPAEAQDTASTDEVWVVFVANRYARRIGPSRLYTTWARAWATHGVSSLRIDVSGTGDAGGPDEETDADMYSSQVIEDTRAALTFLRERHGVRRFAIVGLCSGGFVGFHAALVDQDVAGVVLLNPQMLFWTENETALTLASALRSRVFRPASWKRLLGQRGTMLRYVIPAAAEAVATAARQRSERLIRSLRRQPDVDPIPVRIKESVGALAARGCSLLFVYSAGDAGLEYMERRLGPDYSQVLEGLGARCEIVQGADHTFRALWAQERLRAMLEDHLRSCGVTLATPTPA